MKYLSDFTCFYSYYAISFVDSNTSNFKNKTQKMSTFCLPSSFIKYCSLVFLIASFIVCGSRKVYAQGPARLDYNVLNGNQAAAGTFIVKQSADLIDGPYVHFFGNGIVPGGGSINHIAGFNSLPTAAVHTFQTRTAAVNGGWNTQMAILQNGQVRIGATLPDLTLHGDYKLAVAGKIVGQSLYITRPASWADYVFAPAYKLRPLPELADYINCNQHLPDVPSTAEVLRDGYDLSQMNARLLQKVEELTLYVIALNQKVAALEAAAPRK